MAAGEQQGQRRPPRRRQVEHTMERATLDGAQATSSARTQTKARRQQVARLDLPAVALCPDLELLRAMTPEETRRHVHGYLHDVMPASKADDFEALSYCWELHLVELEQLCLIRSVDLSKRKLGHYRAVLRKGGGFPPLIGLGSDDKRVTENVLLCDGYHRATAMHDVGMHFAWMWLAVGTWQPAPRVLALAHSVC